MLFRRLEFSGEKNGNIINRTKASYKFKLPWVSYMVDLEVLLYYN